MSRPRLVGQTRMSGKLRQGVCFIMMRGFLSDDDSDIAMKSQFIFEPASGPRHVVGRASVLKRNCNRRRASDALALITGKSTRTARMRPRPSGRNLSGAQPRSRRNGGPAKPRSRRNGGPSLPPQPSLKPDSLCSIRCKPPPTRTGHHEERAAH